MDLRIHEFPWIHFFSFGVGGSMDNFFVLLWAKSNHVCWSVATETFPQFASLHESRPCPGTRQYASGVITITCMALLAASSKRRRVSCSGVEFHPTSKRQRRSFAPIASHPHHRLHYLTAAAAHLNTEMGRLGRTLCGGGVRIEISSKMKLVYFNGSSRF